MTTEMNDKMRKTDLDPENETLRKGLEEYKTVTDDPSSMDPIANPFANIETILPRLQESKETTRFLKDESFINMLKDLGQNPLNMQKYLKDDRLRLMLNAMLGFELEHPDRLNLDEPLSVDNNEDTRIPEVTKKGQAVHNSKNKASEEKKLGIDSFSKQNYEKAIEHYNRAMVHDSTDITLYSNKALAYVRQGLNQQVRETSLALVEVWRNYGGDRKVVSKAYRRICQTYLDDGDLTKALENIELAQNISNSAEGRELIKQCHAKIQNSN